MWVRNDGQNFLFAVLFTYLGWGAIPSILLALAINAWTPITLGWAAIVGFAIVGIGIIFVWKPMDR